MRRELLDDVATWPDLDSVQAAIDVFRHEYNTDRPHQSLDMAFPADRFHSSPPGVVPVKLPASLTVSAEPVPPPAPLLVTPPVTSWSGDAVEFDRVVPPSGNLQVAGKQFWLGPARSGITVTFWADTDVVHLTIGGARVRSVRSHLSVTDLANLLRQGVRPAGPPPQPATGPVRVQRRASNTGVVMVVGQKVALGRVNAGKTVTIEVTDTELTIHTDTRTTHRPTHHRPARP